MRNIAICVIPASTKFKNLLRYKDMCAQIAAKLPIINGFDFVSIKSDREDTRAGKTDDTIYNLIFSPMVSGKDIILFDDVTTRGVSFIQTANELKVRGAHSIYGLFLGKTVSA